MKRAAAFATIMVLLAPGAAAAGEQNTMRQALGTLPPFKLTDQNGRFVQRDDLLGKVCVFSVFFCQCNTSCPITQKAMAGLQDKFAAYPDVVLLSINVYPGHDTPSIIADYARGRGADPARWLFLHGERDEIYNFVQGGLLQALAENTAGERGDAVAHTPNFIIVDSRGVIRGYVDGTKAEEVGRLEGFVHQLVLAKYIPPLNAGLNGACASLLVLGFMLIRNRWVLAHKICMLSALLVSAAFLTSYVFYHVAVLNGQPTKFNGEGPIRLVYLGVLWSHIVLAAAVTPMALRVTYLGLRGRLANHTALARWTLPIWLYVSVTGVVVYLMLYQLYPPA
jgi:protein SCO1/2/putative membrane protein